MEELHFSKRDKRIYDHLVEFGSITSWEAIKEYGCTRLADAIYNLRKKGICILTYKEESINRYGERVTFAKYGLFNVNGGSK